MINLIESDIVNLYVKERYTLTQIADKYERSRPYITSILKGQNVSIRSNRESHLANPESLRFLEDKKWLFDHYVLQQMNPFEIGKDIGCSHQAVERALRRYQIHIRNNGEAHSLSIKNPEAFEHLNDANWMRNEYTTKERSTEDIGNELNCSGWSVWNSLHYHNISIRKSYAWTKERTEEQIKKWMESCKLKPNKSELKLEKLLNKILFKEYKYVGDGQFILGRRCPDFLNIDGQKKLIEFYGDYWHKGEDEQERIDYFKEYGFDTLITWEHEMQDEKTLIERILSFNN